MPNLIHEYLTSRNSLKMKKISAILSLLFLSSFSFAQKDFFIGTWKYEKIPDHLEMDEESTKMSNQFFKDMTLTFDATNYTQSVLGRSENGSWTFIEENKYEFSSTKGAKYEVELKKVSENQIILKIEKREWQLMKSDETLSVEKEENVLDKIEGVDIVRELLIGQWFNNGQIKDGKESGLILKHNEEELVNYSFLEDGTFINKGPLEIVIKTPWEIADDNQTIIIEGEEMTESLKVVKLSKTELHLYQPRNNSVLKFKR